MPTNRMQRVLPLRGGYCTSKRVLEKLRSGHDFTLLDPSLGPELDPRQLVDAWKEMGRQLLAEHVTVRPGTRPWGWWEFEAPGPRRQIGDGPDHVGPPDWFGIPHLFAGMPPSDMFESEADYLRRHGLLSAAERACLAT